MNNARLYWTETEYKDYDNFKAIHQETLSVVDLRTTPATKTDGYYEKTGEVEDGRVVYRRKIRE